MIPEDEFIRQIKKASDLNGHLTKRETAIEIYSRLKNCHEDDFYKAIEDLIEEGERITYIALKRALYNRKTSRINREIKEQAEREKKEITALSKGEEIKCQRSRKCYECSRESCSIVGKASIRLALLVASRSMTIEQARVNMADSFPGAWKETEEIF